MTQITLADDRTAIELGAVAQAFGFSIDELENRLRTGTITRWFQHGIGDHANEARLVFFTPASENRVAIDENGIVQSSPNTPGKPATSHKERLRRGVETMTNTEPNKSTTTDTEAAHRARLDALLDAALEGTFPASDPIAISFEDSKPASPAHGDAQ